MITQLIKSEFSKYGVNIPNITISQNKLIFHLKYNYAIEISGIKNIYVSNKQGDELLIIHYNNFKYKSKKLFIIATIIAGEYPNSIESLSKIIKEIETYNNLYEYVLYKVLTHVKKNDGAKN